MVGTRMFYPSNGCPCTYYGHLYSPMPMHTCTHSLCNLTATQSFCHPPLYLWTLSFIASPTRHLSSLPTHHSFPISRSSSSPPCTWTAIPSANITSLTCHPTSLIDAHRGQCVCHSASDTMSLLFCEPVIHSPTSHSIS